MQFIIFRLHLLIQLSKTLQLLLTLDICTMHFQHLILKFVDIAFVQLRCFFHFLFLFPLKFQLLLQTRDRLEMSLNLRL